MHVTSSSESNIGLSQADKIRAQALLLCDEPWLTVIQQANHHLDQNNKTNAENGWVCAQPEIERMHTNGTCKTVQLMQTAGHQR